MRYPLKYFLRQYGMPIPVNENLKSLYWLEIFVKWWRILVRFESNKQNSFKQKLNFEVIKSLQELLKTLF